MKNILLGSLLAIFILNSAICAKRKFDFVVTPTVSSVSGYTKYVYDDYGYITPTVASHVKSELTFPVGATYTGMSFGVRAKPEERLDWSVTLSYGGNLGDPKGWMADRDWSRPDYTAGWLFSYTVSTPRMWARSWSLECRGSVVKCKRLSLGLVAGFQCLRVKQDLLDAVGWQSDMVNPTDTAELAVFGNVGYYSVTWKSPYCGLYFDLHPISSWHTNLMTAFGPTWVADKDIHLLRHREAWANGNGRGFIARAQTELSLGDVRHKVRPLVGLSANWYSYSVKGTQTIYYYGDDPTTGDVNEAKARYAGVPHQMTIQQFNLTLRLGVRF